MKDVGCSQKSKKWLAALTKEEKQNSKRWEIAKVASSSPSVFTSIVAAADQSD